MSYFIVKCGYCGLSMNAENGTARNGERKYYYKCWGRKHGTKCHKEAIQKDLLETIVLEAQNGQFIRNGIKIAIIGRPNVGKSSLLNALLEEEKAIVTNISGTTRDIVEGSVNYKGILLEFIDTAGIRETTDIVEQIGVEKSKEQIDKSDISILVLNYNENITEEDQELISLLDNKKSLIFINKIDLEQKLDLEILSNNVIMGSTLENKGIEELKEAIIKEFNLMDMSHKDLTYLSNTRQITLAKLALESINHVISENENDIPVDMLAIDIQLAWENLGKIIGEYYEDELVDNIFSRFCLGK